jgi:hypothetical protein
VQSVITNQSVTQSYPGRSASVWKKRAKLRCQWARERSQGDAATHHHEEACSLHQVGLHFGLCRGRVLVPVTKPVVGATGRRLLGAASAVCCVRTIWVSHAITSGKRQSHFTGELPPRPRPCGAVGRGDKDHPKRPANAWKAAMDSLQRRHQGTQHSQSRSTPHPAGRTQRLYRRKKPRCSGFMRKVSPMIEATKWPVWTSSRQLVGLLRNVPQQPRSRAATVRSR